MLWAEDTVCDLRNFKLANFTASAAGTYMLWVDELSLWRAHLLAVRLANAVWLSGELGVGVGPT